MEILANTPEGIVFFRKTLKVKEKATKLGPWASVQAKVGWDIRGLQTIGLS